MTQNFSYSVLLPVYHGDYPEYLKVAIDSMLAQTLKPDEIVIAVDGPISKELRGVIESYRTKHEDLFNVHYYSENRGLGLLLRDAIYLCRNEFIARMDADDYSVPERIEKQAEIFRKFPELSAVGCNCIEFEDDISKPAAYVILPEMPQEILEFSRRRNPVSHPTLLYKKSDVIAAGNYRNFYRIEDYDLVMRILHKLPKGGGGIYNIQEMLYCMRINKDFYKRRTGLKFLIVVIKLETYFLRENFISFKDYFIRCSVQTFINLMPSSFCEWFYKKFLRG